MPYEQQNMPAAAAGAADAFVLGDEVEANWGGVWCYGFVTYCYPYGSYLVQFPNGDVTDHAPREMLRRFGCTLRARVDRNVANDSIVNSHWLILREMRKFEWSLYSVGYQLIP